MMVTQRMGPHALEVALGLGLAGLGVLVLLVLAWIWQRGRRLKVVQEALRSGAIDVETKRELLASTFGALRVPWTYRLGWFGMFASAAMLFADEPAFWRWHVGAPWWTTAVFAFALSLGAITMPFAARELHGRRRAQPAGRVEP